MLRRINEHHINESWSYFYFGNRHVRRIIMEKQKCSTIITINKWVMTMLQRASANNYVLVLHLNVLMIWFEHLL